MVNKILDDGQIISARTPIDYTNLPLVWSMQEYEYDRDGAYKPLLTDYTTPPANASVSSYYAVANFNKLTDSDIAAYYNKRYYAEFTAESSGYVSLKLSWDGYITIYKTFETVETEVYTSDTSENTAQTIKIPVSIGTTRIDVCVYTEAEEDFTLEVIGANCRLSYTDATGFDGEYTGTLPISVSGSVISLNYDTIDFEVDGSNNLALKLASVEIPVGDQVVELDTGVFFTSTPDQDAEWTTVSVREGHRVLVAVDNSGGHTITFGSGFTGVTSITDTGVVTKLLYYDGSTWRESSSSIESLWLIHEYATDDGASYEPTLADFNLTSILDSEISTITKQASNRKIYDASYSQYSHKMYEIDVYVDSETTLDLVIAWDKQLVIYTQFEGTLTEEFTTGTDDNTETDFEITLAAGKTRLIILTYTGEADKTFALSITDDVYFSSTNRFPIIANGIKQTAYTYADLELLTYEQMEQLTYAEMSGIAISDSPFAPRYDDTYDLGEDALRWKKLYVTDIDSTNPIDEATHSATSNTSTYSETANTSTYSQTANTASYSTTSATSTYANTSNHATVATSANSSTYSLSANTSTFATTSTTSTYSDTANTASYSTTSATSTYAVGAGTSNTSAYSETANTSTYSQTANTASYSGTSATSTYAVGAGTSNTSTYNETSNTSTYSLTASTSTYSVTAAHAIELGNGVITISGNDAIFDDNIEPAGSGQDIGTSGDPWYGLFVDDLSHGASLGSSAYLGFFGDNGSDMDSVANVSTSTTSIADVRDKLNELIDALQSYNLV